VFVEYGLLVLLSGNRPLRALIHALAFLQQFSVRWSRRLIGALADNQAWHRPVCAPTAACSKHVIWYSLVHSLASVFNSSYPAASLLVLVPLETTVVLQLSLSLERRA